MKLFTYTLLACTLLGPITIHAQESTLRARIAEIRAQITSLQIELTALENQLPLSCTITTSYLTLGMSTSDVHCLQQYLNKKGFTLALSGPGSPGNETQFFGNLTKGALSRWQQSHNINNSGVWDLTSYNQYRSENGFVEPQTNQTSPTSNTAPSVSSISQPSVRIGTNLSTYPTQQITSSGSAHIDSISPTIVRDGDEVVISGTGFTRNMTLIVRYGVAEQRTIISSTDGKTAYFTFKDPLPEAPVLNVLPPDIQQDVLTAIESAGLTYDDFLEGTASSSNSVDPYTVILVINGESIVANQILNHVR